MLIYFCGKIYDFNSDLSRIIINTLSLPKSKMRTILFAAAVTMLSTMEPTMALPLAAYAGLDADVFAQVDSNFCRTYLAEKDEEFQELLTDDIAGVG